VPSSERSQERGSGAGVLGGGVVGVNAVGGGVGVVGVSAAGFGVAGAGVLAVVGVAGFGVADGAGPGVGVVGVAGLDVASRHVGVAVGGGAVGGLAAGAPPAGRRGAVDWVRIADSNRLNASLVSPARASAAPATCSLNPAEDPPESLALRAARQIGHHWHSGGSSVGSVVVASSQTSVYCFARPPPMVDFTRSVTSLVMLRAPAFISQRWKSPNGSLPGCSLILAA
jgi:hypothetical protein